jgi:hypothetical protein
VIVVVSSSSAAQLERLREELRGVPAEDMVTIVGDIGQLDEPERNREVLLVRVGRPDVLVASLGRWNHGPSLVEASFEMRERASGDQLAQGYGGYTSVKRTVMEHAVTHVGPSAIIEAAQDMLVPVLPKELADTHVGINEAFVCPDTNMRKRVRDPPEAWSVTA